MVSSDLTCFEDADAQKGSIFAALAAFWLSLVVLFGAYDEPQCGLSL